MKRFLVLDRDGTIIVDKGYLGDPDGVELIPGAAEALKAAQDAGWGLIVVTNQSGVGRGFFDIESVHAVHAKLTEELAQFQVKPDGIFFNTDHPDKATPDRKPGTGLVDKAAKQLGFTAKECVVIGDKDADIQLARNLGAKSIRVLTGYGKEGTVQADYTLESLADLMTVLPLL